MFPRIFLISGLLVAMLSMAGQAVAAEAGALTFGVISTASTQTLKKRWQPFLADMQKAMGVKVTGYYASDYAGIIESMRTGKVQVAWFGNKSAIQAVDRSGGEVFAQAISLNGAPGYHSHLIVHKDSPLNSLDDVLKHSKRLTFGNGDPNSTSGFLVPSYYVFAKHKVDPGQAFKSMTSASHEANALAVAGRHVDVATNNSVDLLQLEKTYPDKRAQIKVVWTSPLIPNDALVWRKDLSDLMKSRIRHFIYSYGVQGKNAEREKQILAALPWSGFRPSSNDQLLAIRQLELFKTRTRIDADMSIPPAEKAAKLDEIDGKLDEMQARSAR